MRVGIVGASGAVGLEIIKLLESRRFKLTSLSLFGSSKSAGRYLYFKKKRIQIKKLNKQGLKNLDLVFFSAGSNISEKFANIAASYGAIVIDNSSAFRMNPKIPLIVPEINPQDLIKSKSQIIATPNCTTIISLMAIKPLHDLSKIRRIVATSFQSVSGAGNEGIEELLVNTSSFLKNKRGLNPVFKKEIAFNVIPKIGNFYKNLYSEEEMKLHNESRKILSDKKINISATTVRVPVIRSHSISLNIEFTSNVTVNNAVKALKSFPGVKIEASSKKISFPTPIEATERDYCIVGRLRRDFTRENSLSLWVVGDQIRKGAALNAVQIAELL